MKKHLPAAILIAVTLMAFLSCKWFQSRNTPQFSITGQWTLDSMYSVKSTPDTSFLPFLLLTINDKPVFTFGKDSTLQQTTAKGNVAERYYLADSTVFIKEDTVFTPYRLSVFSNSLITLTGNDSIQLRLKKQ